MSMGVYIDREAALRGWPLCDEPADAYQYIRSYPAADVRPVVLCKDCEYCRREDEYEYWCNGFCSPERLVRKDDFCSHGKAKECVPYFPEPQKGETDG